MVTTSLKKDYSHLPLVPESVLKRRHDLDDLARKKAAAEPVKGKPVRSKTKGFYVKSLETFMARGKSRRNHEMRYKRVLKKGMQKRASNKPLKAIKHVTEEQPDGTEVVTEIPYQANSVGANMVFCIRTRDHQNTPRQVRRALGRLRLRNPHEGVFLRYDDSTRKLLHLVEPWVVYGPPSTKTVKDLIERRGFAKIDGKRVPLSDNTVIERALGDKHNILCVEDLVHEISTTGEAFSAAASFLWPFRLADSLTSFERQTLKKDLGKNYGDRGQAIDEYIKQVL
jgi:large subunit ribosomal protein L7e